MKKEIHSLTCLFFGPTRNSVRFCVSRFVSQNGKFGKAIKAFESILSDLLEKFGEEHHRVGAALHNVAVANLRAGLLDDARDAIEEAVRIRKLTLGKEDSKVAVSSSS